MAVSEDNPWLRVSRRSFLKHATLMAVTLSIPAFSCKRNDDDPKIADGECQTTKDILGPFYKPGSPFREDIIPSDAHGEPLVVEGKVYSNCNVPIEGAVVEIWNADDEGTYDTSESFRFRGQYKTGADGVYRFRTIFPGRYLNGNTFRPSHIHFRITAPGHQELISQIYFKDDPFIDDDPWAGSPNAVARILTISADTNGTDTVNFNIYLIPA